MLNAQRFMVMKVKYLAFDADEFIALVVGSTHAEPSMVRHDATSSQANGVCYTN